MKVTLKIPTPKESTYSVSGKTIVDVFKALNKHGWWGRYRSHEAMSYKGSPVNEVTLSAKPQVFLPKWSDYGKMSKDVKKSWDDMYKALEKHEYNHHDKFKDQVTEFKKELEKGGDLDKKDMDKAWSDFVRATQKVQDAYDTKTDHGAKEGVILEQP